MWLALLIFPLILVLFFFVPPSNSLIIISLIILVSVEIGLISKFIFKKANNLIRRLFSIYLPIWIAIFLILQWQGILDAYLLVYILVLNLILEIFLRVRGI